MVKIAQIIMVGVLVNGIGQAQLSTSAYRALGQPDLRQNGVNRVQGVETYAPMALAVDARDGAIHLYVADTRNNRILAWQNARSYQTGDPPTIVLGQPSPLHSAPLGIGTAGLSAPVGLAVDPITGSLYVADYGNNRVLRFPKPFANPTRVEPDAVYGQPDFTNRGANTGGIGRNSMRSPRAVAFDTSGNLWVADTGNHRVLRFNSAILDNASPEADLVIGQRDFANGGANRGLAAVSASGFDTPAGLAFDLQNNLYVSDYANARLLKFAAPVVADAAASVVFGQSSFTTRGAPSQASAATLAGPAGITVDGSGNLYVAIPADHRVLVFNANASTGAAARDVLGQTDFNSNQPNASSYPLASVRSFYGVSDVKVDADGTVYAADTGNNRVIAFAANSKTASKVWGQIDFSANGANQIKAGSINAPYKIVIDYSQSPFALYVSDTNNHRVLVWRDATRFRTGDPADLVIGQPNLNTALANVDTRGAKNPSRTSLSSPKGLALDAGGNLYVADSDNNRVLRYPRPVNQTGRITPDAVIGQADFTSSTSAALSASSLRAPAGLAIGPDGNLFVADSGNNRVLEYAVGAGMNAAAIRVFGQPNLNAAAPSSPASAQTLLAPQGIFVDGGSVLYVADAGNNRVLVFPNTRDALANGAIAAAVLGQDTFDAVAAGRFHQPMDVAADSQGNIIVADSGNNRVLVFPPLMLLPLSGATPSYVIGQRETTGARANWNSPDGLATPEGLYGPVGLFVDRQDTLYIGDAGNNRVVHYLKAAVASHAANPQTGVALARGGVVSLAGNGLSEAEGSAPEAPWPFVLAGREVVFNDELRAPLSSVSATQIGLQVPASMAPGSQRLAVRIADTGELVAGGAVVVAAVSPGLFTGGDTKSKFTIQNFDGSPNSAANPALRGSTIKVFGTGQGQVSPAVGDGEAAPSSPPANTIAVPTSDGGTCLNNQPSVCVAIGNTFGEIQFSGLAPGLVGIWQITVKIPASVTANGAVPLRAMINGVPSNLASVAIR
jgi:uncharacterized protein (TIGR03437 family)